MSEKQTLYISAIAIVIGLIALGLAYSNNAAGPEGPMGPQGVAGPQGDPGLQGASGAAGADGSDGADGVADYSLIKAEKGLVVAAVDAGIGSDLKAWITLEISDPYGLPINPDDLMGVRFMLAAITVDETTGQTDYMNYFLDEDVGKSYTYNGQTIEPALATWDNPDRDSGGEWEEESTGVWTYTFGNVVPSDYDKSATHVLGLYAEKDPVGRHGESITNVIYAFVPDGSDVETTRLITETESCNRCHDPLSLHGGTRQEVTLCLLCHNPDSADPESGNTVDMKVMIHKIHKGAELHEVEEGGAYYIVGYGGSVHDYSEVEFPADVRDCEICHTGPDGDNWMTQPSRAACGSCHDDVDFATGDGHGPGLPQANDERCAMCHSSEMGAEFDTSIPGAHMIDEESSLLTGVIFEILSVTDTAPGEYPTVTYTIKNNAGDIISLEDMDRVRFVVAGPSTDFTEYWRENGGLDSVDNGDDTYSYTIENPIPADAEGSYGIGIEGRTVVDIDEDRTGVRDTAFNEVFYFAVTDSAAVSRRTIVSQENCDSCHNGLSLHGGGRLNVQYCGFCHMPSESDEEVRPEDEMPPMTIDFKYMIHAIHLGEERDEDLIIYGYRGSLHNYSAVVYPGDLRDCAACHVDDSYALPMASGVLPTKVYENGTLVSSTPAATSACTACHDSDATMAHAELMTTDAGVESCAVCHGTGHDFDVVTAHDTIHYADLVMVSFPED